MASDSAEEERATVHDLLMKYHGHDLRYEIPLVKIFHFPAQISNNNSSSNWDSADDSSQRSSETASMTSDNEATTSQTLFALPTETLFSIFKKVPPYFRPNIERIRGFRFMTWEQHYQEKARKFGMRLTEGMVFELGYEGAVDDLMRLKVKKIPAVASYNDPDGIHFSWNEPRELVPGFETLDRRLAIMEASFNRIVKATLAKESLSTVRGDCYGYLKWKEAPKRRMAELLIR